ncbi:MAG: 2,4'-dihydroxyacetophenone dioxygenase family protein [Parvularculaceae bacterium]|nr:2,4'-dihydroxyacetophenone dioxygenase family protein [Parvularculaceae bacterium]
MGMVPDVKHQERLFTIDTTKEQAVDVSSVMPGVTSIPLFLDPENGIWVVYSTFQPGTVLPTHFHTGTVHFYTTQGCWHYREYPADVQTAGCYLYEPGGAIHTFVVPEDATEPAAGFMVVYGANVNFDENGNFLNIMDAGMIERTTNQVAAQNGLNPLRYIKPRGGAEFSTGACA